jgi:hypothetical protein
MGWSNRTVPVTVSDRNVEGAAVFVQDQTSPILTVPFLIGRAFVTLAVDTVLDSRDITLTGGHGTLVGEVMELADTVALKFMQSTVVAVNTNVITLDQPVNRVYLAAGPTIVQRSSEDLLVDGSSTPQVFSILPLPSQAGDMVRIIMEIEGTTDMDQTTFGSDDALFNGCVIRMREDDGNFKNLFNFKSNGDFLAQGFDHSFLQPKLGNAIRGFAGRITWGGQSKHGVVIRLDGSLAERLEVVIQDDLTLGVNTKFKITAQGHELQM